jgi:hypothetical protein
MTAIKTLALGAAGIAALAGASTPASAQYYGGYPYGGSPYGYGQYGYSPDIIGQVLQSILNPYGNFGYGYGAVNPQVAVNQCTQAVQQRLSGGYGAYGYGGYGSYGYSPYGYTNGYRNGRILGITRVEQRSPTTLRVRGYATSGMNYGPYGSGAYGSYGYGYGYAQPADLSFKCDVDYRGYIRDLDINRRY